MRAWVLGAHPGFACVGARIRHRQTQPKDLRSFFDECMIHHIRNRSAAASKSTLGSFRRFNAHAVLTDRSAQHQHRARCVSHGDMHARAGSDQLGKEQRRANAADQRADNSLSIWGLLRFCDSASANCHECRGGLGYTA